MNSLTANNRLSQQLVVSVAEHLLLRHECRLPNHLAVSNHRELYLTVGGELCRNLTAGFVTEEDFMFMLFVGSQKHSALSIFAKTTRMSALVLCGNSGVILLSVKDHQHIDSAIPGRYTVLAPYKAGAGRENPEFTKAHNRALAVFLCHEQHYAQIMVGRAGPTSVGPGSLVTGFSPLYVSPPIAVRSLGGELLKITKEAAIMATIPTLTQPEIAIVDGQAVTSSLAVANFFSKRHDDVLKKIRTLECSASFTARNFSVSDYTDCTGRKLPCYQITRDGFAFLAMGFTGKRAARFKEAYINAFNQMEKLLSKPSTLSDAADNASVLYSHLSVIHKVWLQQLYPMLAKAESPLAVSLYDRINDAALLASLINLSLNPSEARGRK
ncbi:Rha family transcriptional regulator [Escherichia coli]|uniref:Rha family phage regulatory protein n=2 Tax=Escherichia coli TaxID=562 RepID=UPI003D15FC0E